MRSQNHQMSIEYIYDPEKIDRILQEHRLLSQKLGELRQEERQTISFPRAMKSERQIYRILSSQHYTHLEDLLKTLEFCLDNGWEQPKLLKTKREKAFAAAVSELLVADYFLKRGLTIKGFEKERKQTPVPDLLVQAGQFLISVEVYAPCDWDGVEYFLEDVRLGILHLDTPWDFHFEIEMKLIDHFDCKGKLLRFDPWRFAEAYESPTIRWKTIKPLLSKIDAHLRKFINHEFVVSLPDENQNIFTKVHIQQIQRSEHCTPARFGSPPHLTITGHDPEGMFDRMVKRRIMKKIARKQALSIAEKHLTALLVDVSGLGYQEEFEHSYYIQKFAESVRRHLDPRLCEIDMVIFFIPKRDRSTGVKFPLIFRKSKISDDILQRFLGSKQTFNRITPAVLINNLKEN
jgi:hypothetical protein